jgi:hypothetical protein
MTSYRYVVITCRGGIGGHDHGSWTGHPDKEDALECAESVGGIPYKVKIKGDNHVLKQVKREAKK